MYSTTFMRLPVHNAHVNQSLAGMLAKLGLVKLRDVNLVQVERGMARFYRQYQREQSSDDQRLYEAAVDAAIAEKRGLWHDTHPVAPWEFRHAKRSR
jgi:endonuclease YncB( thermonuclease family)